MEENPKHDRKTNTQMFELFKNNHNLNDRPLDKNLKFLKLATPVNTIHIFFTIIEKFSLFKNQD